MSLEAGRTLGPYWILEPIGKGGMGEVFRARDTKLERDVAIKVLPDDFSRDEERLERFDREAKLLAQLNHGNIATLYGVEELDGQPCLIMELVTGETLAARLERGPLTVREALPVFRQLAEALEAAHERGIVHRDLKPENVAITDGDRVKVLDFGLGKRLSRAPARSSTAEIVKNLTESGTVMGTVAYMSPEQARGEIVDARTDVWSFGAVLYEALTGESPFLAGSLSETFSAILNRDPDWDALPPELPTALHKLVRRCLEKDRRTRAQHMGDVRIELEELISQPTHEWVYGVPRARQKRALWALGALLALAIAALTVVIARRPAPTDERVMRFEIPIPESRVIPRGADTPLAISRDGASIAYATTDGIYVRELGRLKEHVIPGVDATAEGLTFSPDGHWLAFYDSERIQKARLPGGMPTTITDTDEPPISLSWHNDNALRFGSTSNGILQVRGDGGSPMPAVTTDESFDVTYRPTFVEDAGLLLYLVGNAAAQTLVVRRIAGGDARPLLEDVLDYRYTLRRQIVYLTARGELFVTRFDAERLEASRPVRIPGILVAGPFDLSRDGTLVYLPPPENARRSLVWVDRSDGSTVPATNDRQAFARPRLSPDGKSVALHVEDPETMFDVWIYDLARGSKIRLTNGAMHETEPLWTPDGNRVLYFSSTDLDDRTPGEYMSYVLWEPADGSGKAELVLANETVGSPHSLHRRDNVLAYYRFAPGQDRDIWLYSLEGDADPMPFRVTPYNERSPSFSPDGRFIAYVSDESGRDEIYVEPYPGPGRREVISTSGGYNPVWSRDGRELFYRNGNQFMAVAIETESGFRAGLPELMFEGDFLVEPNPASGSQTYDVSLDGQRFLAVVPDRSTTRIVVVVNWFQELEQLLAGAN